MNIRVLFFLTIISFSISAFSQDTINYPEEQKMSIDVKDTDLRDVIRMISKGYNINILLDNDVSGKITLHLVDVPIMEALHSIAQSNGLEVVKDGMVYKIKKATAEQKSLIRYADGKLTIDVQNIEVKSFLKELSSKTAISIVPDAKVEGNITGKLYQVDLDDGLRVLLEGNGFKVVKRKNIYQIISANEKSGPQQLFQGKPSFTSSSTNFFVEYNNGLISLEVNNGDLEEIIKAITEQSDIEIITYGSIKTEINAKLKDIPLTEALALLLGGTRFTFVQKENVILIGDRNTATPSGQTLSKSELIHLKHIKADNLPSILPKDIPPTNVRVIKEQNALLISGTSEDIVAAKEFLNTIDIPTPQVRIDAVIVEFKDNIDKGSAFRAGRNRGLQDSSYNITPFPQHKYNTTASQGFELGVSGKDLKKFLKELNLPVIEHIPDDLFAVLRMMEVQNKAKILAQPSILTLNGNKASIDVSETQYFTIVTGVGENQTSRFQPIKFGITLDIVPWISQSGQITAEITPNVSNSDKTNEDGYPNVSSRSITTTVRLNNGQTLALGGLIKNQESEYSYKVPFLGSIPIIGALFRQSGKMRQKSNLVVFITPHIITEKENLELEKELEKYDLNDRSFIERRIYSVKKKLQSRAEDKDSIMSLKPDSSSAKAPFAKLQEDSSVSVVSRPEPKPEPSDSSLRRHARKSDRRYQTPEPEFSGSENKPRKNRTEIKPVNPDSTDNRSNK
jgi:type IV pilus assembly protein PilQ